MYHERRRESSLKLLFMMIKKQAKMPKKLKYKASEYKLNDIRRTMYDLERLKFTPCTALNLQLLKSIDDKLLILRKEEDVLVKYRLKA